MRGKSLQEQLKKARREVEERKERLEKVQADYEDLSENGCLLTMVSYLKATKKLIYAKMDLKEARKARDQLLKQLDRHAKVTTTAMERLAGIRWTCRERNRG
eukprot:11520690-Alexandrium_andersonii.AAC.1